MQNLITSLNFISANFRLCNVIAHNSLIFTTFINRKVFSLKKHIIFPQYFDGMQQGQFGKMIHCEKCFVIVNFYPMPILFNIKLLKTWNS